MKLLDSRSGRKSQRPIRKLRIWISEGLIQIITIILPYQRQADSILHGDSRISSCLKSGVRLARGGAASEEEEDVIVFGGLSPVEPSRAASLLLVYHLYRDLVIISPTIILCAFVKLVFLFVFFQTKP